MSEVLCLELSVVLWIVQVLGQLVTARAEFGDAYLMGPRDEERKPSGVMCGRARRAMANYTENLVPFAALDVALIATHHTGGLGPTIWILARIVHYPLYLSGIPYLRTAAWGVAIVGLVMMLTRLAGL